MFLKFLWAENNLGTCTYKKMRKKYWKKSTLKIKEIENLNTNLLHSSHAENNICINLSLSPVIW